MPNADTTLLYQQMGSVIEGLRALNETIEIRSTQWGEVAGPTSGGCSDCSP